jgi:hypothetical protein
MGRKLSPEDRARLEALLAGDDEDDDFEVEIFSGDRGARVPYSKAADWLFREFGIGPAPEGAPAGGTDGGQGGQGAPRLSLWRGRGGSQGAPQGEGAPQGQGAPQGAPRGLPGGQGRG